MNSKPQKLSIKELAQIFPETPQILREKALETLEQVLDARWRILNSYWHSLKAPEAKPICEATAELISENELQPLQKRFKRLVWQHKLLTSPPIEEVPKLPDPEQIKARVDLREVVEQYGIKLRRAGKYWIGLCPFHSEKKPSFFVYEDHFHCYGCGAHGDIFTFLQLKENLNFKEALEVLTQYYG